MSEHRRDAHLRVCAYLSPALYCGEHVSESRFA